MMNFFFFVCLVELLSAFPFIVGSRLTRPSAAFHSAFGRNHSRYLSPGCFKDKGSDAYWLDSLHSTEVLWEEEVMEEACLTG